MLLIGAEEGWLPLQTTVISEFVDSIDSVVDKVQAEYLVFFYEDDVGSIFCSADIFKEELHACVLEFFLVFEDQPVFKLEFGGMSIFDISEDEQLVDFFFVSYQALSTDDSDVLLVLTLLDGDDLVRLPCLFVFEKLNIQFINEFE